MRREDSRAAWTAGISKPINSEMMPITRRSSINVRPRVTRRLVARLLHVKGLKALVLKGQKAPDLNGRVTTPGYERRPSGLIAKQVTSPV